MNQNPWCGTQRGRLVTGITVVTLGVLLLAGNLGLVRARSIWHYWPMILVLAGLMHIIDGQSVHRRVWGAVIAGAGLLLVADNLGYLSFRIWNYWPLLLILWGLLLLLGRTQPQGRKSGVITTRLSSLDEVAIFGGGKRIITADDFRGGDITAICGGCEIDLRQAGMDGNVVTIDANVICGGAEIKVPQNWDVSMQGVGIFGGFGDETTHPTPGTPGIRRLIVKGSAVFGGVAVKN